MKKALPIIIFLVILAILFGFQLMGTYNYLIGAKEKIDGQWAQVENQYQRRFDLIPNLVESVKGIMGQEQEVFGKIAEARTRYAGAETVADKAEAASQVESALSRLLVIMENYPQLRSSENVSTLMVQLEGTENRIGVERQRYNDLVREYNTKIKRFPEKIFASIFGFGEAEYFDAVENAETPPKVEF